ncbi:MAG: sugar transferase [Terriglobales bacterium]
MATNTSEVGLQEVPSVSDTSHAAVAAPAKLGGSLKTTWNISVDALLLCLSGLIPYVLRYGPAENWDLVRIFSGPNQQMFRETLGLWLVYAAFVVLFCHVQHLYGPLPARTFVEESAAVLKAVAWSTLLLTSLLYLSHFWRVSRAAVLFGAGLSVMMLLSWRYSRRRTVEQRLARGVGTRNVIIVGAGKVGRALAHHLNRNRHLGYQVKGFIDKHDHDPSVLGRIEDLPQLARAHFIDAVFITIPSERELVKEVALLARHLRISVKVVPELYDGLAWRAPLHYLGDFPVRVLHHEPVPAFALLMKRLADLACAGGALVLLAPLFAVIAAIIKLDSPGPVFYSSKRVGKKGRIFLCHKFRTMVANAEDLRKDIEHLNEREGILFKVSNDPRVTRVGKWLRKYSLDELPQLWNVLVGEMSLVGPRPAIPSEFEQYDLEHFRRLDMTPGLTGLWQVKARNDPSFATYMSLDVEYIENWSPWLDLKLVLKTIPVVLRGTGN